MTHVDQPRILIVIGQVLAEPWLTITREGQLPTWVAEANRHGVAVRHSHGNQPSRLTQRLDRWHEWLRWHEVGRKAVPLIDNALGRPFRRRIPRVSISEFLSPEHVGWHQRLLDVYALQRWKVVGSLQTALLEEWDFIYFTTASSYIRIEALQVKAQSLPRVNCYAGAPFTDALTGEEFASGANRWFSRDLAKQLIEQRHRYANDVMEDVGIGRLARQLGAPLVPLPSRNITSPTELASIDDAELLQHYHFRLTSGTRAARQDVPLMHALHKRFEEIAP